MLRRKQILQEQAHANTEKLLHINTISRLGGSTAASKQVGGNSSYQLSSQRSSQQHKSSTLTGSHLLQTRLQLPKVELHLSSGYKRSSEQSWYGKVATRTQPIESSKKQKIEIDEESAGRLDEAKDFRHPLMADDSDDSLVSPQKVRRSFTVKKKAAIPTNDIVSDMASKKFLSNKQADLSESNKWIVSPEQIYVNQSIQLDEPKPDAITNQSRISGFTAPKKTNPEVKCY
jgi:hypothetical protein